jgi:hypothetical protein
MIAATRLDSTRRDDDADLELDVGGRSAGKVEDVERAVPDGSCANMTAALLRVSGASGRMSVPVPTMPHPVMMAATDGQMEAAKQRDGSRRGGRASTMLRKDCLPTNDRPDRFAASKWRKPTLTARLEGAEPRTSPSSRALF